MARLRSKLLQTVLPMQCLPCTTHVTLVLLNVRSIVSKLVDIQADHELNSANVLRFCETWLSSTQLSPVIKTDHVVLRCDRATNDHKDGTMISMPHSMQPNHPMCFVSNGIEVTVTTLHINKKTLQVAVVYRSPTVPMCQFIQLMTRLLEHMTKANAPTIVLGDFNDDILYSTHSQIHNLMISHDYTQLVNDATTDRATLIDHVYFNMSCDEVQVRDVYYSDHDAVYCSTPICLL